MSHSHQIAIIGGGTAGITVAAQLRKADSTLNICIIDPSEKHYYQPAWTLVGAGTYTFDDTVRSEADFIPKGVTWIKDYVETINMDQQELMLRSGDTVQFEYLVAAPGIQLNFDQVEGLAENIGTQGITSNYDKRYVNYTWELLKGMNGGRAIFTNPATPIKCGGAPMKIMYMADDYWRREGVRKDIQIDFVTSGSVIFGVPGFKERLQKIVSDRDLKCHYLHHLTKLDAVNKVAHFEPTTYEGQSFDLEYDMIHVTPPQSAPDFIQNSPLAHSDGPSKGWINVDIHTLQHNVYQNVFALGDAAAVPTAKTGAAVRKQAPVVVKNLLDVMKQKPIAANKQYDGYSSCPIVTGYNKMLLAEFLYDNVPAPSLPLDTTKERYSMWLLKKYLLPWMYWNMMLKGRA